MCLMSLYLFFFFFFVLFYNCPHLYICIVCMYIWFKLYLSVFECLLSVFNVNCMHQGSESNAISILCMYVCTVHVEELTIKLYLT